MQNSKMPRNGRPTAAERVGNFAGRSSAFSQQRQDAASSWIRERSESAVCRHRR
jgi:hypothetical protein